MDIQPLNQHVFIKMDTDEQVTASGIVLPENNLEQKTASIGTIYRIGENELGLEDGDTVLFSRYSAEDVRVKISETEHIELKDVYEDAISAKIND